MGVRHGARAPLPGVHRGVGWSHRRRHACSKAATRPARAGAPERTGPRVVPVDGRITRRRGRSAAPGRGRSAARGCRWPPASGRSRPTPRGCGGEHPGASGRAIARETLPGTAKTGEIGEGSQRSRATARRVAEGEIGTLRPWSGRVFAEGHPRLTCAAVAAIGLQAAIVRPARWVQCLYTEQPLRWLTNVIRQPLWTTT
jgi:hypothetical protein